MKIWPAIVFALLTFPALAAPRTIPVDEINAALKGHIWTFPLDGKPTSLAFKEFHRVRGYTYVITVEVK